MPNPLPRRDFLAWSLAATGLAACRTGAEGDPGFEVTVLREVMVTMRDGVRLATDIYLPARQGTAAPGRFPVILERTPYDKSAPSRSERGPGAAVAMERAEVAAFFVRRGYVMVYQDCRGRCRSRRWARRTRRAPGPAVRWWRQQRRPR
jgi:predicted acyl esterase